MKRNLLLYLICFLFSIVLVSFYGGSFSYLLVYFLFFLAFACLLYTFYVFVRLSLYQDIPTHAITKGELVPYELLLENNDLISFLNIRLLFFEETAQLHLSSEDDGAFLKESAALSPHTKITQEGSLECRYSGLYEIGVKQIEIMDFLHLFRIRYPVPQPKRITVKPRVLALEELPFWRNYQMQSPLYPSTNKSSQLSADVRNYVPGDDPKRIHWKNSSRMRELMVRNAETQEQTSIIIAMDNYFPKEIQEDISLNRIYCDKFLELNLAFNHYFERNHIAIENVLTNGEKGTYPVHSPIDFGHYYETLCNYHFNGSQSAFQLLLTHCPKALISNQIILITCHFQKKDFAQWQQWEEEKRFITILVVYSGEDTDQTVLNDVRESIGSMQYVHLIPIAADGDLISYFAS